MPVTENIKAAVATQAFSLAIKTAPARAHHVKTTAEHYIKIANVRPSAPTAGLPIPVHVAEHTPQPAPIARAEKEFINAKQFPLRLAYAV